MSRKIYLLRTENNLTQSEFAKIAGATDKARFVLGKGNTVPKTPVHKANMRNISGSMSTHLLMK